MRSRLNYKNLKPQNGIAFLYTFIWLTVTILGIILSSLPSIAGWLVGQITLGLAMLHWFIYLHEAGHGTLFRSRLLNRFFGNVAGFLTVIPFDAWRLIHSRHHKWTGWQDLDATTESLVPRKLSLIERVILNFCWKFSIPLFVLLYRIQNFWNYPRIRNFITVPVQRKKILASILLLIVLYGALIISIGWPRLVHFIGLAFLLCLVMQELIIMSQHTHIPMRISQGQRVSPLSFQEQEAFTRSLRFPHWISRWILMHMDAHTLHHIYPWVPGYRLNEIDYHPDEVNWLLWWRESKKLTGVEFMFNNRNKTGFRL